MFDHFICDTSCPVCGNYISHDYQTKDLECMLDTYHPGDMVDSRRIKSINVYTTCVHEVCITGIDSDCIRTEVNGVWIEYDIPVIDGVIAQDQNTWVRRTEPNTHHSLVCIPRDMTNEDFLMRVILANNRAEHDILITEIEHNLREAKSP